MWHQLSSDHHFLGCWVCRLKKVNLFFGFSFFGNYVYAPAAFQWHTFFHIFSAVKCQASQHHLPGNHGTRTRTHLKCPESAAASSLCKFVEDRIHGSLEQFFLAIDSAMPASFSPTQKYRFPACQTRMSERFAAWTHPWPANLWHLLLNFYCNWYLVWIGIETMLGWKKFHMIQSEPSFQHLPNRLCQATRTWYAAMDLMFG